MSDSNWEAPTPGTAADTAKPHWSKRKAGPLPVWGWIASGMVLLGVIGAVTDEPVDDDAATAPPVTVEAEPIESDDEATDEATAAESNADETGDVADDEASIVDELSEDIEALEDFYDDLKEKVSETADRVVTAIDTVRNDDGAENVDANESATEERDAAPATTAPPVETTAAPPVETTAAPAATPAESVSQREARESAASYLRVSSFSRSGLIDQLEFEGFSTEDATYGVDAQNADWFAQAAATAERYLEISSFSRSELIGQLEFEGFTSEQAVHGVNAVGL